MKLEGIKRLLGDSGERLIALKRAAGEVPETPEVITAAELGERLQLSAEDDPRKLLAKAQKLGILVPLGEGVFEVPSPRCWPPPRRSCGTAWASATRST